MKKQTFFSNVLYEYAVWIKCFLLFFQLKPVERLALRFVESTNTYTVEDEVEETEKMLQERKKEWELNHLQSMKEEKERKNAEEEDDMFFTYIRDDGHPAEQVNNKKAGKAKRPSRRASSVTTNSDTDVDAITLESNKNIRVNIQPLLLKLGGKKIEEIKKTAQKTIQARNNNSLKTPKSPRTPTRARKSSTVNQTVVTGPKKSVPNKLIKTPTVEKASLISSGKLNALKLCIAASTKTTVTNSNNKKSTLGRRSSVTTNENNAQRNVKPSPGRRKKDVTLDDFISKTTPLAKTNPTNQLMTTNSRERRQALKTTSSTTLSASRISSGASSPASLGSPDSLNGDIRRSSRAPRPKVMNDDWVV